MSCDPIGCAADLNLYSYANNSPLRFIDVTGKQPAPPANPDNIGNVAAYDQQPRAGRDSSSRRTTENEHVMPKGNLQELTRNPATGQADYTDQHYRRDTTVRVERDTALNKTHGNRGGPNADNPRTSSLKQGVSTGGEINYRSGIFEPSIDNMIRARNDTASRSN